MQKKESAMSIFFVVFIIEKPNLDIYENRNVLCPKLAKKIGKNVEKNETSGHGK